MTSRLALAAVLTIAACAPGSDAPAPDASTDAPPLALAAGEAAVPADSGASAPRLALDADGRPLLSWAEPDGDGHALRYARWAGSGWGEVQTADAGPDWFVNWADTPGVVPLAGGRLLAHTLARHAEGGSTYAYDVRVRLSDGAGWSAPVRPHTDGVAAEHGFVSALPLADGRAGLVWLDGRQQGGGHGHDTGAMTIRYATLAPDGALSDEAVLDARTCDCCPTAAALAAAGPVVVYRDRSAGEVRDIAIVRRVGGRWTEPALVHADGWEIAGCPVNGPSVVADGDRVVVAWYTEGGGAPSVRLATSLDGGATFGEPASLTDAVPIGRVGLALRPDGSAVASWMERRGDAAALVLRAVSARGALGPPVEATAMRSGRESGVPHVVTVGDRALVAWVEPGAAVPIRTALVDL